MLIVGILLLSWPEKGGLPVVRMEWRQSRDEVPRFSPAVVR